MKFFIRLSPFITYLLLLSPLFLWAQSGPGGVGTTDGNSTLQLWLRANSGVATNSNGISTWADNSGNSRDASPGSASSAPSAISNGLNSKPTISFDGSDDYLDLSSTVPTGTSGAITVFIAFKPLNPIGAGSAATTLLASQSTGATEGIIALGNYLGSNTSETITFSQQGGTNPAGHYHEGTISRISLSTILTLLLLPQLVITNRIP